MNFPIERIRLDFPILKEKMNGRSLVYLDSAASAQKPEAVIRCENNFYRKEYSSVYRGTYSLSNQATERVEKTRDIVAKFINASYEEIIFTKGTTEGINLIANSLGNDILNIGDNIVITEMEHHSNMVPWKMLSKRKGVSLRSVPFLPDGTLDLYALTILVDKNTKIFSITEVSNVLGTLNPLRKIVSLVRSVSQALILIDGAQAIMHHVIDVKKIDCDFYVFSGHKLYGPTGIGILYGKKELLNSMTPLEFGGGSMIRSIDSKKEIIFNDAPWRFEAGSPNVTGILGLGSAINYLKKIGMSAIEMYERELMRYSLNLLQQISNIRLYGPTGSHRTGVISFNIGKHHSYDIGMMLNQFGIAVRTGHHCSIPIMNYFKVSSMCRISLAIYTKKKDIDYLIDSLLQINRMLKNRR